MDPFTLSVSQEELLVLSNLAGINGINDMFTFDINEETPLSITSCTEAVCHSLLARQLIAPTSGKSYEVDPDVIRIFEICIHPETVVVFTTSAGDTGEKLQETYFKFGEVAIHHFRPYDEVHYFSLLPVVPNYSKIVVDIVQKYTQAEGKPRIGIDLDQSILEAAQKEANTGHSEKAVALLLNANLAYDVATLLVNALVLPTVRLTVHLLSAERNDQIPALTLLCDQQRCWSMWMNEGLDRRIFLKTNTLDEIKSFLIDDTSSSII